MAEETIVAIFDSAEHAEAAVHDLTAAGVPAGAISTHSHSGDVASTTGTSAPKAPGFLSRLFGGETDHDTAVYDRSLEAGSTVVSVSAPDEHVTAVSEILERHNPIDIDERASTYGSAAVAPTSTAGAAAATTGIARGLADRRIATPAIGESLQLAEEQLVVGKKLVNHGTTRVRRFVVETPVEEQVTLHDEKVIIDRQPIADGRAVDGNAFTDQVIEMAETGEEAVVGKTTRVREEVHLRKEAVDRVETVRDTVRREDVAIENVPGAVPVERKI